jgi:spore coat protein U-like protein
MSKFNRVLAAAVILAGLPMAAMAQVNVNVQVQVAQTCSVSVPINADFGSQSPTGVVNLTTTGAVTLTCNRGAAPQVSVGNGGNFSGGTRNMINGANLVAYTVKHSIINGSDFTDCPNFGLGTDWGSVGAARLAAGAAFSASGGPRTVNLCFQTTVDQNTAVATYTDTVSVSVGF